MANEQQVSYKTLTPRLRNMIMLGLLLAMIAACLDGTIVGTVGTVIAEDLDGLGLFAWMTTAYMLCEAVMIPIAGKLSDIYGRKYLFLFGCVFFLIASIVAGMSTSMTMFIVARAVQGIGGGTIVPVVTAAIADLYEPTKRARMQGLIGAIFGIGSGIGPLVGGALAEYGSWHWCFYINIPFTVAAILLTFYVYPKTTRAKDQHVDYWGITALTLLLLDVLLLLEFGGDDFAWVSWETAVMVVVAVVLLLIFIYLEKRAIDPVLAPHLLKNRTVVLGCIFMAIFGIGMMGSMMYTNMLVITVFGLTTMQAGLWSLAMVVGMMITSLSSGMLVNRTGYRFWLIIGPIISLIGLASLSLIDVTTTMFVQNGTAIEYLAADDFMLHYLVSIFVLGAGLGCMMAVVNSAVQNSSRPSEMGMTTSAVNLMRTIGMTLGTAIFAMVINTLLSGNLDRLVPGLTSAYGVSGTGILDHLGDILTNPDFGWNGFTGTLVAFADSVTTTFLVGGVIIFLLVFVGIVFKVKVPDKDDDEAGTVGGGQ